MSLLPISAVVITKNEAANIQRCISALQQVVSEVLVVDAYSIDDTVAIAEQMGATLIQKKWIGYGVNKNLGNQIATYDWVLSIDADEVLSDELIQSLQQLALQQHQVYAINRLVNYMGQWVYHSGWYPDWKVRLFNKTAIQWEEHALVHEELIIPANKRIVRLKGALYHYSYKSEEDHWNKIEHYAQLAALQMAQLNRRANLLKLYAAPIARFFKTFLFKKGFMDGKLGWKISCRNAYLVYRKYQILRTIEQTGNGKNTETQGHGV